MPGPSNSKVAPGEPFRPPPADVWNGMVDAGDAYRAQQLSQEPPPLLRPRKTDIIRVKNGSSAQRLRGEVLGNFTALTTDLDPTHPSVTGAAPARMKGYAVLLTDCPDGETVEAQVHGACVATVNIVSTVHRYADIDPGNYKLKSDINGPVELLYAPASTGDQTCLVLLSGSNARPGKFYRFTMNEAWGATTATAADSDILELDGTDTTLDEDVYDPLGIFVDMTTGDEGLCWFQDGKFYAVNADCGSA